MQENEELESVNVSLKVRAEFIFLFNVFWYGRGPWVLSSLGDASIVAVLGPRGHLLRSSLQPSHLAGTYTVSIAAALTGPEMDT